MPGNMDSEGRQNCHRLYVIGTPIGNLGDLTVRAIQILRSTPYWLVEDTRRAQQLGAYIDTIEVTTPPSNAKGSPEKESGGSRKYFRLDDALEASKREAALDAVFSPHGEKKNWQSKMEPQNGDSAYRSAVLISDAGTPGVNDPAAFAVQYCLERGIEVVPVPGVSALTTLWSITGWQIKTAYFLGYLPRKEGELGRIFGDWCKRFAPFQRDNVFFAYESPHRIVEVLNQLNNITQKLEINSEVVIAKEMTKIFERFFRGNFEDSAKAVELEMEKNGPKGEWAFAFRLLGGQFQSENQELLKPILEAILKGGVKPSVAASWISQLFGEDRKSVYQMAMDLKEK